MRLLEPSEGACATAGICTMLASLTLNDVAMIVGILTAIITALYATQRRLEERREHLIRVRELEGKYGTCEAKK